MCRCRARLELSRVLILSLLRISIRPYTPLEVSLFPNLSTIPAEVWHKYVKCSMYIQVNKRKECHKRKHHRIVKQNDPKHSFYSTCISHFTGSTIPFPIQSRSYLQHSGTRLEPRSLNLQSNFHPTISLF